jgi:hypothetical protein
MNRSTVEVFEDHLVRMLCGDLEGDLAANFARDCVLLTSYGRFDGHDGRREACRLLARHLPQARFHYKQRYVHKEIAFLEWTAEADGGVVTDGADTFLIRDGRIRVMTVHYTVLPTPR